MNRDPCYIPLEPSRPPDHFRGGRVASNEVAKVSIHVGLDYASCPNCDLKNKGRICNKRPAPGHEGDASIKPLAFSRNDGQSVHDREKGGVNLEGTSKLSVTGFQMLAPLMNLLYQNGLGYSGARSASHRTLISRELRSVMIA